LWNSRKIRSLETGESARLLLASFVPLMPQGVRADL